MRRLLAWMGRHGTGLSAGSIFIGLALQDLAALARPWLAVMVAVILTLALLLVDAGRLRQVVARPLPLAVGAIAMAMATPALLAATAGFLEPLIGPGLLLGLFVFAFAPPTLSAPAFAALMGLDAASALALCLGLTVVSPLLIPAVSALIGVDFPIEPVSLAGRLALIVGSAVVVAAAVRRRLGSERITANREVVTGLMILPLTVFAIGSMDGMVARLMAEPGHLAAILAGSVALAVGAILLLTAIVWPFGRRAALAIGWCGGNRNLGLIIGAMSGVVPDDTWAYFAMAQFPIYALPVVAIRIYRYARP